MTWGADPVVITVAPTGAEVTRELTPYLPVTPEEIAKEVARSVGEGASVVHIHARTDDGRPTTDPEVLRAIKEAILERCEVVIGMSTGAQVGMHEDTRTRVLDAAPEMASLNCGSMNFGEDVFDNPPSLIRALAKRMQRDGVRPECEIYDLGMLGTVRQLMEEGLFDDSPVYNFVLGVRGGAAATLENLLTLLHNCPAPGVWNVTGVGRNQLPLTTVACAIGGNMRVGFEDNIFYRQGELAKSNAELVARARRIAEELGRPVATVGQARQILGVTRV